jgi:RNA polymerase sigma factor (sigma-70 family)
MPSTRPSPSAKEDRPSLRQIFEAEQSPLLGFAISIVRRRAVAEEIVQEVFLQLHRHWDSVENPKAWLYRSIRNRSLDHLRRQKREVFSEDNAPGIEAPDDCRNDIPADAVQNLEAAGYLRLSMAELSDDDRQLVELKYFQDLKYREISEQTGLTVGNVGYRLHHILNRLADQLRQLGIDGASAVISDQ